VPSPSHLDKKLAAFLKKQRGAMSFAAFSKKTGFSPSMLFRLENCEQSITLGRLQQLMERLKVNLDDVFGPPKR
jgi:transcriptional regulator with XRE-family HTH domain